MSTEDNRSMLGRWSGPRATPSWTFEGPSRLAGADSPQTCRVKRESSRWNQERFDRDRAAVERSSSTAQDAADYDPKPDSPHRRHGARGVLGRHGTTGTIRTTQHDVVATAWTDQHQTERPAPCGLSNIDGSGLLIRGLRDR
jgi:hypothetical protein